MTDASSLEVSASDGIADVPSLDGSASSAAAEARGGAAAGADRRLDPQLRLQQALDLSYRYLGFRDRTVVELRRHLEAKRVEPATIEQAVAELLAQGYLDDARFAQRFAEDKRALEAWGADRIERKLLAAGVEPELIAAALAEQDEAGELDAAVTVLRRRFREPLADARERDRALGLLVRKGYDLELAYDAIRAYARDAG